MSLLACVYSSRCLSAPHAPTAVPPNARASMGLAPMLSTNSSALARSSWWERQPSWQAVQGWGFSSHPLTTMLVGHPIMSGGWRWAGERWHWHRLGAEMLPNTVSVVVLVGGGWERRGGKWIVLGRVFRYPGSLF